jgi:hypothetical protein
MSPHTLRPFLPAAVLLLLSMGAALAAVSGRTASGDRMVAALFNPNWSAERAFAAVAAAGGSVVSEGALRTIVTAQGKDGLRSSLYRHGAWLVIDVPFQGCGWRRPSPSP